MKYLNPPYKQFPWIYVLAKTHLGSSPCAIEHPLWIMVHKRHNMEVYDNLMISSSSVFATKGTTTVISICAPWFHKCFVSAHKHPSKRNNLNAYCWFIFTCASSNRYGILFSYKQFLLIWTTHWYWYSVDDQLFWITISMLPLLVVVVIHISFKRFRTKSINKWPCFSFTIMR